MEHAEVLKHADHPLDLMNRLQDLSGVTAEQYVCECIDTDAAIEFEGGYLVQIAPYMDQPFGLHRFEEDSCTLTDLGMFDDVEALAVALKHYKSKSDREKMIGRNPWNV